MAHKAQLLLKLVTAPGVTHIVLFFRYAKCMSYKVIRLTAECQKKTWEIRQKSMKLSQSPPGAHGMPMCGAVSETKGTIET